ncbi:MAG: leucine-rich repeat domain-containing protein [Clostridia bacterium]|nr:leucine-rich repeat domain-containing protein [Clostridia bacterium]
MLSCIAGLTACNEEPLLQFTLSEDGTYYICEYGYMWAEEKEIEIPSVYKNKPVAEIGSFHFQYLESVTIPDSVKTIGKGAFDGCGNLKNVSIGSGVTTIGTSAFQGCTSLESITIPDNVTTIEELAFNQCDNLKNITFGKGIKTINSYTFFYCENLKNIVLPDTVEVIGDNAFTSCGLENITIGNGLTTIGEYAFRHCKLKTIVLPSSLSSIGDRAFLECDNLETVILDGKEKITFGYLPIDECPNFKCIYAKCTLNQWTAAENTAPFPTIVAVYSETAPKEYPYCWHYVDGEITDWDEIS